MDTSKVKAKSPESIISNRNYFENQVSEAYYSQTSIYRAPWAKVNSPGKWRGTVNRGRIYATLLMKLLFGRKEIGLVNRGTR